MDSGQLALTTFVAHSRARAARAALRHQTEVQGAFAPPRASTRSKHGVEIDCM
jgi:hypothetical protein